MSQDPEIIREQIEETRGRMGETVEALAYKTDVPARARDAVSNRVEAIRGKVSDVMGSTTNALSDTASNVQATAKNVTASVPSFVGSSPLGLAVGSAAVGFLIGLLLPVTDIERERVGPIGEQMTEQAKSAAADAIEQGKVAVQQAIGSAINAT